MKPLVRIVAIAVLLAVCVSAVLFLRKSQLKVRHVTTAMQDVQVVRDYFLRNFAYISRDNDAVVFTKDNDLDFHNRLSQSSAPPENKLILRARDSFTGAGVDSSMSYSVSSIGPEAVEIRYIRTSAASREPVITTDQGTVEIPYSPAWAKAVTERDAEGVKALLTEGLDVNSRDGLGRTPLFLAALQDDRDMAVVLLAHGADPNVRADNRMSGLMMAADNPDMVKLFVDAGADINAQDANGDTALIWSLRNVDYELPNPAFDLLISSGADITIQNIHGFSVQTFFIQNNIQYTMPARGSLYIPRVPHLDKKGNKHEDKLRWNK